MRKKIKVLIVDDSAVARQTLTDILAKDSKIEVVGAAVDPFFAAEKIKQIVPDVIILDVEMPRMDGLTFLKKIMSQHPIPVVMCSALTKEGCETTLKALEYGAVEIVQKPRIDVKEFFETSVVRICDAVKAAAVARLDHLATNILVMPKLTADAVIKRSSTKAMIRTTEKVVVIGASTGGTEALRILVQGLPLDSPGVVIVLHMPEHFTKAYAKRLDDLCPITVKEAASGDTVRTGRVLVAPGNQHLLVKRSGARYFVEVQEGPLVCRQRPSVDVLFRSASRYAGKNAIGIILTGMGEDGASGLLEMKEAGAKTIAQNEKTCVVFGMPNEAIKRNAVDHVLPLESIAPKLIKICQSF